MEECVVSAKIAPLFWSKPDGSAQHTRPRDLTKQSKYAKHLNIFPCRSCESQSWHWPQNYFQFTFLPYTAWKPSYDFFRNKSVATCQTKQSLLRLFHLVVGNSQWFTKFYPLDHSLSWPAMDHHPLWTNCKNLNTKRFLRSCYWLLNISFYKNSTASRSIIVDNLEWKKNGLHAQFPHPNKIMLFTMQ